MQYQSKRTRSKANMSCTRIMDSWASGHAGSRKGDIICLILGASVPFLLRPYGNKYIFVGQCYVYGLMNGEGLVNARKIVQPEYDHEDMSWLGPLHKELFFSSWRSLSLNRKVVLRNYPKHVSLYPRYLILDDVASTE